MGTTQSFSNMLNEFLPNELLKEGFVKRDYVMTNADQDESWKGGKMIVPFQGAGASSIAFGSLTAANDVAEAQNVRGEISGPKEAWGTLIFNHRDLMEHGSLSEQNLLKILPDMVNDFLNYFKNVVSTNFLNGAHFDTVAVAYTGTDGLVTVNRPDRFVIGQKVIVEGPYTAYVKAINMNTKVVTLVTTRGGATTDFTTGANLDVGDKIYHDGSASNGFNSIRDALLPASAGGSATLYGVTKTAWPYTQAIAASGADITSANIMEKIFDHLVKVRKFGKGNVTDIVLSYTNLGHCMKVIESSKGAFNVMAGSQKASQYGWTELMVGGLTQAPVKLVGVQEADDDVIMFLDWAGIKFYSNGMFKKRMSPDGNEYFEVRNTTGYQYIVDVCLFGELVVTRPSYQGILYSISIA